MVIKPDDTMNFVTMFVKSAPTAAALLIMAWMGMNFLEKNIAVQNELMKKQNEFNLAQNQYNANQAVFNQGLLKAVDEISKGMADIHTDVNTLKK